MNRPRIAYLLKKFPRLSETFVLGEMVGQESLGRALHVFSRRAPDDEPRHPELARLRASVEVLPDKHELDPWRLLYEGHLASERLFADVGRVVARAPEWNHPRFSSLLCEAIWLRGRTEELGIEHLHVHFATDSALVAMILRELGGPSYSLTAHAKDIYRRTIDPHRLSQLVERSAFTVTVCDANVRHLEDRLEPAATGRLRRLYNGIDLGAYRFVTEGRDPDLVLGVGRLVEKKGFDVLVEAVARLRSAGRAVRCVIVGDGEEREALEALRQECGLADAVELRGACDQAVVRELMARATVLCAPCVVGADGNRDALPTVLLEALASGLPAVSTPVTGIPEILDVGGAGVLVPSANAAATAEALARLLDDEGERARLARCGRAHAERCFDARRQARRLHDWLDEALDSEGKPCASLV